MKRTLAAILTAVMLMTSCTSDPAEDISPADAAAESGVLTGVYTAAVQIPDDGRQTTPLLPSEENIQTGTASEDASDDAPEDPGIASYCWLSWDDAGSLQIITRTGEAEIAVDVKKNTETASAAMGRNGIYTIEFAGEGAPTRLYHFDTSGNVVKAADISKFRPSDDRMFSWWPSLNGQLPILETSDGYILAWGNTVITLDDNFRSPVYQTHPSEITGLFRDEVQGKIWISYEDQGTVLRDTASDTVLRLPDASEMRSRTVVGVHDGLVYCMDRKSIHRYSLPGETPEILMSFENSSLSETPSLAVLCTDGDQMHFSMIFGSGSHRLMYFMPGDDIDLNDITILELAVSGQHPRLLNTVYAFNASRKDCRIIVNDYSRFNNAEDMNAGLYRFRLDLETGILTPDLIYLTPLEYTDIVTNSPDMLCDLYSLDYTDAKYTPDDLWTAVRHAGEVDGKLYAVLARFELCCPVGLKEYTADLAGWDLEGFLDWAESLPENEYVMDAYGKNNARKPLVGNGDWNWIPFYEQGSFDDPLYVRYLNYINSLPDVGPVIQQKRSGNADDLILSGDYHEDDIIFDAGGENMYQNGAIKLTDLTLSSINHLIRLMDTLGAESVGELNFVGYPSGRGRGIEVRDDYNSVFCVMSRCESPELAWKFAEFMLEQTAEESLQSPYNSLIPALKEHALALLESIEGTEVFFGYIDDFIFNEPATVERLKNKREPGRFFTIDSAVTDLLTELLDSELLKLSDRLPMDLRNILTEEESAMLNGEQTVQTTAEAVASRTAIYIAEKN